MTTNSGLSVKIINLCLPTATVNGNKGQKYKSKREVGAKKYRKHSKVRHHISLAHTYASPCLVNRRNQAFEFCGFCIWELGYYATSCDYNISCGFRGRYAHPRSFTIGAHNSHWSHFSGKRVRYYSVQGTSPLFRMLVLFGCELDYAQWRLQKAEAHCAAPG